jgi:hypothetical protein
MAVFWDVAPCSLVDNEQRFRKAYCPIIRVMMMEAVRSSDMSISTRLHGATSQKIAIFIRIAVRT